MRTTPPESIGGLVAAPELRTLARTLPKTRAVTASGLWGSSVAAVVAAIRDKTKQPLLLICGHLDEADDLADDIELFTRQRPEVLPALELGGGLGQVREEQASNRLRLICRVAENEEKPDVTVAPIQALMQSVPSRDQLEHLIHTIRTGQQLEAEKLIVW